MWNKSSNLYLKNDSLAQLFTNEGQSPAPAKHLYKLCFYAGADPEPVSSPS